MKIATAAEMREIDKTAMEWFGQPGVSLMENAGRAVADKVTELLGEPRGKIVFIVCGGGNNGGDGYVAARWLHNRGARVKLFLAVDRARIRGDALVHLETALRMGIECFDHTEPRGLEKARIAVAFADLVVDALLGTGFQGELYPNYAESIDLINGSGKTVLAVDIPSGVDADTGRVKQKAVKANCTVTFGLPKPGLLLYPGAGCVGEMVVAEIGLPQELLTAATIRQTLVNSDYIAGRLPKRDPDSHKGTFGHVLMLAGSRGFSGAAFLAAQGALRAGAGLVTLAVPAGIGPVIEMKTTEAMTLELPETPSGGLGSDALRLVQDFSARCASVLIGPGLGRHPETSELVCEWVETLDCPLVLDADGLIAVSKKMKVLERNDHPTILTPHPGEMARLTGLTVSQIQTDRLGIVRKMAAEWRCIVVLKGARTIIGLPGGELFVNVSGNPAMATGGTGDVLAGMIAALIGQGLPAEQATVLAVYLHGRAGDLAAASSPVGMTALDLAEQIPQAIRPFVI